MDSLRIDVLFAPGGLFSCPVLDHWTLLMDLFSSEILAILLSTNSK